MSAPHRLLVLVTGMPDEAPRGCGGSCNQGRGACDCELALDIAPDDQRVIQPPITTPEDRAYVARARREAMLLVAVGIAVLVALLELFGAPPRH